MADGKSGDGGLKRHFKQGGWLTRKDNVSSGMFYGMPSRREAEREELLADWIGEERRAEVFAALRPQEHSIGNLVDAFAKSVSVEKIDLLDKIKADWAHIIGEDNAKQCVPVELRGRKMTVEVFSSAWLFILKNQYGMLIARKVADYTNGEVDGVFWRASRRFGR